MSNSTAIDEEERNKTSNKQFRVLVRISLIIGIVIISGFIIYYALTPEPGYVTFGILNENQEAENYPTKASVNESIFFFVTVYNYLDRDFSFNIQIKKGDDTTKMNPSSGSNGILDFIIGNFTINHNERWISEKLNTSFSLLGEDQKIIAELHEITKTKVVFYSLLYLRLNITA
ncbi:MAG: DUF1616 domain-containing protein [Promethearchaeota archaeon]